MKEPVKYQQNLIVVLTEKQHVELKEIAKKVRNPDYFAKGHYDIMNANRMRGPEWRDSVSVLG
jgi:hypothetical protein